MNAKKQNRISLIEAIAVIIIILICLGAGIIRFQMPPQVPILLVFALLCMWGKIKGFSWDDIHKGIIKGIEPGIVPLIIFMLIGTLVASLIAAGTIPTVVVYGYKIISAKYLPVTAFIICIAEGLTIGSSFTTISTMGVVLITLGRISEIPDAYIAGAIVSGAFFANNMSPLADVPNLCSAIGEIPLSKHLRNLAKSTLPVLVISIIIYVILGGSANEVSGGIAETIQSLNKFFFVSPITLVPILLIFIASWRKLPAIASLLIGIISALIIYVFFAPNSSLQNVANLVMTGYASNTGLETIDKIFSRGGIMSMMGSASMIILALGMGGLLVKLEIFSTVIKHIEHFVKNQTALVIFNSVGCILTGILIGEQYLTVVLPGETFKPLYKKMNIPMHVMTRTLSGAGAAFSSIVPWSVAGTFIIGTLGLSNVNYIFYAFYPMLIPISTIILSFIKNEKNKI